MERFFIDPRRLRQKRQGPLGQHIEEFATQVIEQGYSGGAPVGNFSLSLNSVDGWGSSMAHTGRLEAGLYLIGLLNYCACDLRRLEVIAEQLGHFPHESSANALLAEIRRLRSSNTTRRYLARVLRSLVVLPPHLVRSGLELLAGDTSFSYKMRAKLRDCCERIWI